MQQNLTLLKLHKGQYISSPSDHPLMHLAYKILSTIHLTSIAIVTLAWVCCTTTAFAQLTYSDHELSAFAQIYLEQKSQNKTNENKFIDALADSEISHEAYAEMLKDALAGQRVKNIESAAPLINNILQQNAQLLASHQNRIRILCEIYALRFSRYEQMLAQYKTHVQFQQLLRPFFRKIILNN